LNSRGSCAARAHVPHEFAGRRTRSQPIRIFMLAAADPLVIWHCDRDDEVVVGFPTSPILLTSSDLVMCGYALAGAFVWPSEDVRSAAGRS